MTKASARKNLLMACAAAVGIFTAGSKHTPTKAVTTETAAASSAQVMPTEPKLRVEPK